jgi:uncharacterized phage protein (TIGR01671 family)
MREIKFRGWDNQNEVFIDETDFYVDGKGVAYCYDAPTEVWMSGGPIVLQQFTGLKDSKGVEIYEGDIVKQNAQYTERGSSDFAYSMTYIGVVRVEASKGAVLSHISCTDDIDGNTFKVKHRKGIAGYRAEVIGNIHENPELLEKP